MSNNNNNNNNNNTGNNGQDQGVRRFIRGPQSALTDFLASQNISAARIRTEAQARRAAATANLATLGTATATATATVTATATAAAEEDGDDDDDDVVATRSVANAARRARVAKRQKQQQAIAEIKESKAKNKKRKRGADGDSDDDLLALLSATAPRPGQMSNCEICNKRFTVTPYTRSGPNGGLLCAPCGREQAKDEDANKKQQKKRGPVPKGVPGRRKVQSRILDGTYTIGAKPLVTLCVETLAKNIHLADDLGDLALSVIDRIARLLSKSRLLDSRTLDLFLQPGHEVVNMYDAARLSSDDLIRIFQRVPKLKRLKLRNAIQFTDNVMDYLNTRSISLESLDIHGANLLTKDKWTHFFTNKGRDLHEFKVQYTDKHFDDDVVKALADNCSELNRLKICHNQFLSDQGIKHIARMNQLVHVSLQTLKKTTTESYIDIIKDLGPQLETFSIEKVDHVDDRLLDAIHMNCTNLSKLRITESRFMTDAGFTRLFRDWKNKPLSYLDLQKCRYVDAARPRVNEHQVGLCSEGFEALMEHSGKGLRYLNVHACRNISRATFEKVFGEDKVYPLLRHLEISFCEEVNDFVVGLIFRSCPAVKEVNVFGCMKVKDVRVPRGKILVGVPNAVGMRIEGAD
ncbi:RNI-like protein [Xylariaceae sp. FL0594]|nr:RNI-like protein [Xylariaceae sp. FL0594]